MVDAFEKLDINGARKLIEEGADVNFSFPFSKKLLLSMYRKQLEDQIDLLGANVTEQAINELANYFNKRSQDFGFEEITNFDEILNIHNRNFYHCVSKIIISYQKNEKLNESELTKVFILITFCSLIDNFEDFPALYKLVDEQANQLVNLLAVCGDDENFEDIFLSLINLLLQKETLSAADLATLFFKNLFFTDQEGLGISSTILSHYCSFARKINLDFNFIRFLMVHGAKFDVGSRLGFFPICYRLHSNYYYESPLILDEMCSDQEIALGKLFVDEFGVSAKKLFDLKQSTQEVFEHAFGSMNSDLFYLLFSAGEDEFLKSLNLCDSEFNYEEMDNPGLYEYKKYTFKLDEQGQFIENYHTDFEEIKKLISKAKNRSIEITFSENQIFISAYQSTDFQDNNLPHANCLDIGGTDCGMPQGKKKASFYILPLFKALFNLNLSNPNNRNVPTQCQKA